MLFDGNPARVLQSDHRLVTSEESLRSLQLSCSLQFEHKRSLREPVDELKVVLEEIAPQYNSFNTHYEKMESIMHK